MEKLMWQAPCANAETVSDGAARFVRECFGAERTVTWGAAVGEFWFHDSAWRYRISCAGGHWLVHRTGEPSPRGKAYSEARRAQRPAAGVSIADDDGSPD